MPLFFFRCGTRRLFPRRRRASLSPAVFLNSLNSRKQVAVAGLLRRPSPPVDPRDRFPGVPSSSSPPHRVQGAAGARRRCLCLRRRSSGSENSSRRRRRFTPLRRSPCRRRATPVSLFLPSASTSLLATPVHAIARRRPPFFARAPSGSETNLNPQIQKQRAVTPYPPVRSVSVTERGLAQWQ